MVVNTAVINKEPGMPRFKRMGPALFSPQRKRWATVYAGFQEELFGSCRDVLSTLLELQAGDVESVVRSAAAMMAASRREKPACRAHVYVESFGAAPKKGTP